MITFCALWIISRPCAVLNLQGGRPVLEQSLLHTVPAEVLILHYLRSSRRYGGKFNYTCDDAPGLETPRVRMTKTYGMNLENCSRPSRKHGKWVAKGKYWYALSTVLTTTAVALWSAPGSSLLPSWLELDKQHIILCSTCHILKWVQSTTHSYEASRNSLFVVSDSVNIWASKQKTGWIYVSSFKPMMSSSNSLKCFV